MRHEKEARKTQKLIQNERNMMAITVNIIEERNVMANSLEHIAYSI